MTNLRTPEPDASLRRVQRDGVIICGASALISLALTGGRPEGALGVLAGGALMAFSYRAIKGGVDAIVARSLPAGDQRQPVSEPALTAEHIPPAQGVEGPAVASPATRRAVAWAVAKFVARYGIIAVAAWAVLVPLRAHPLGLFAGVTAPILAIGIEAMRLQRRRPP